MYKLYYIYHRLIYHLSIGFYRLLFISIRYNKPTFKNVSLQVQTFRYKNNFFKFFFSYTNEIFYETFMKY